MTRSAEVVFDAQAPVERIETAHARQHPGQAGELDGGHGGEALRLQQHGREQFTGEA